MRYLPGQRHPDDFFNAYEKEKVYNAMLSTLKKSKVKVKTAVTLPGIRNFVFERMLIKEFGDITIHCFENNPINFKTIMNELSIPKQVCMWEEDIRSGNVLSSLHEKGITSELIFADFCGAAPDNFYSWVHPYMTPNGIVALTTFTKRGIHHIFPQAGELYEQVISVYNYGNVAFSAYRSLERLPQKPRYTPLVVAPVVKKVQPRKPCIKIHKNEYIKQEMSEEIKGLIRAFKIHFRTLPETEQLLFHMYYVKRLGQLKISKKLHMTQGAVSHRLKKACKRLSFLLHRPQYTDEQRIIVKNIFGVISEKLFSIMYQTTCQSETARCLKELYPKLNWTQTVVRHRFKSMLQKLHEFFVYTPLRYVPKGTNREEYQESLRTIYRVMKDVDNNKYILWEVAGRYQKEREQVNSTTAIQRYFVRKRPQKGVLVPEFFEGTEAKLPCISDVYSTSTLTN
jgi:RNA polymerase sigma factor (sigma-70 family)